MRQKRKISLPVFMFLAGFMLFAAGISGCSGCSGCSKDGKSLKDMISGKSEGTLTVTVYAYCPCARCNTKKWKGRVSSGQTMGKLLARGKGICAADPSVIPMGSIVTYNGKEYVVDDTGSGIKGNTINILLESHKDVYDFGVKKDQTITFKK
ncbi:MAG TPA: 3D domain-containing protein [Spirochaetota bacterium]|nr:3D domain-containing protein [Spirochaetota bacterium]HPV39681.1 3D domain-containing protein [Spirochaetota bacterium]